MTLFCVWLVFAFVFGLIEGLLRPYPPFGRIGTGLMTGGLYLSIIAVAFVVGLLIGGLIEIATMFF